MKKHLLLSATRRFLCKHRTTACRTPSVRHFADKPEDTSQKSEVQKKEDSQLPRANLYDESPKKKYAFNNAEAPEDYVDPASTDEHYHIKRAVRLLKIEAKKIWHNIQDPTGRYQGDSLFPTHVDILIIGGGAIGTSVAYFLKEKVLDGCRVAVVDRDFTVNYDLKEVKYLLIVFI